MSHRGTVRAGSFESDSRLALGLYKCSTMGILPTGTSDWLQFETRSDVSSNLLPSILRIS